jgi:hypothetical protein
MFPALLMFSVGVCMFVVATLDSPGWRYLLSKSDLIVGIKIGSVVTWFAMAAAGWLGAWACRYLDRMGSRSEDTQMG